MLRKLLKYDLKSIFKFLIIFYSLALFFGILTRIFFSIQNSFIMKLIGDICSGVTISMMFNIIINNLIRLWVRFKQNLYGDESYLTHTLPVEKKNLYLSKILTAVVTLFTSIAVIGLTLFISYYSKENLGILKNILLPVVTIYGGTLIKLLLLFLFILFLEFACALQSGFTGMILAHQKNNNKTGFSILFGFITYIITQTLVLFIMFVVGIFNKDIMNLFFTNEIVNVDILNMIIYLTSGIYMVMLIIGYFVNINLLKKGVNVD